MTLKDCCNTLLWFLLGGWEMGLLWILFGIISIIMIYPIFLGITWQCFKIGIYCFCPCGGELKRPDVLCGSACCLCNILWIIFPGWILFLFHIFFWLLFCIFGLCGVEVGKYHYELAFCSLAPYGVTFSSSDSDSNNNAGVPPV